MATHIQAFPAQRPLWQRWMWPLLVLVSLVLVYLLVRISPIESETFPKSWNIGLRAQIDSFQKWVIANRSTHPLFVYFLVPFSSAIDSGMRWAESLLLKSSWLLIVALFGLLGYALKGVRLAMLCVIGLMLCGMFGLWEQSMQTLALMVISVLLSLLIGIPLGLLAGLSDKLDRMLRPVLDAMQTMPAFVYLIPLLLFFGIGRVPAVIATMIYAIPPAIRLTNLGIRQVAPSVVEAGRAFGSTKQQLLWKVQLPLALPTILTGVNQTIMMALSMVVIAALIGAGGLGREVLISLDKLEVGKGFEAGLAIVFLAIILDRLSHALSTIDPTAPKLTPQQQVPSWFPQRFESSLVLVLAIGQRIAEFPARALGRVVRVEALRNGLLRYATLLNCVLLLALLWLITNAMGLSTGFPATWRVGLHSQVNALVDWMKYNLYQIGDLPIGTGPFSDFLTLYLLNPMRTLLRDQLSWPVVMLAISALAYWAGGWRLSLVSLVGLLLIGMLGMWEHSMDTLSQLIITMLVTVLVAIPLGIVTSQSKLVADLLRPVLDFLQTIPTFVYLVPVIMLFNLGRVPGLIAAALYAIPPGIKLTEMGLRQVAPETLDAARSFGSTRLQTIFKVQLPLAMPAIMLGVNQMIMMVLAMISIAGLVGSGALGLEVVTGLRRVETGRGIEAGLAIVILAIILDRITQAWAAKQER